MGFRHNDIKIENLLYDSNRDIKLCDFGSINKEEWNFAKIKESEYYKYEEFFEKHVTQMYRPPETCDLFHKQIGSFEKLIIYLKLNNLI